MKFKKFLPLLIFVLAVFITMSGTSIYSQGKVKKVSRTEKTSTIQGEVIDLSCYLSDGSKATGDSHKECALACAKAGSPLAILTKDGEIYIPVVGMGKNANDKLIDYVAQQVVVTGTLLQQGNQKGIKIESVKKAK